MRHWTLREGEPLLKERNRTGKVVAVGQRARHDNSTLGNKVSAGRSGPQFVPQFTNLCPLTHGSVAVSQDRVLIGGIAQQTEGLKFSGCGLPFLLAIQGEPVQLVHRCNRWRFVDKLLEDPGCIGKALSLKVLSGFSQTTFDAFGACRADGATQLLANLSGKINWGWVTSTRTTPSYCRRGFVSNLSDDRFVFRSTRIICGPTLCIGGFVRNGARSSSASGIGPALRRGRFDSISPGSRGTDNTSTGCGTCAASSDSAPCAWSLERRTFRPAIFGG